MKKLVKKAKDALFYLSMVGMMLLGLGIVLVFVGIGDYILKTLFN